MEPLFYLIGVAGSTVVTLVSVYFALRAKAKAREILLRERLTQAREAEGGLADLGIGRSDTDSTKIEVKRDTASTAITF